MIVRQGYKVILPKKLSTSSHEKTYLACTNGAFTLLS